MSSEDIPTGVKENRTVGNLIGRKPGVINYVRTRNTGE